MYYVWIPLYALFYEWNFRNLEFLGISQEIARKKKKKKTKQLRLIWYLNQPHHYELELKGGAPIPAPNENLIPRVKVNMKR